MSEVGGSLNLSLKDSLFPIVAPSLICENWQILLMTFSKAFTLFSNSDWD